MDAERPLKVHDKEHRLDPIAEKAVKAIRQHCRETGEDWAAVLDRPNMHPKRKSAPSRLRRIVNGFLWQFDHQTQTGAPDCKSRYNYNIMAYGSGRDYAEDCLPALYHAGFAASILKASGLAEDAAEAEAILKTIIRETIEAFVEERGSVVSHDRISASVPRKMDNIWQIAVSKADNRKAGDSPYNMPL